MLPTDLAGAAGALVLVLALVLLLRAGLRHLPGRRPGAPSGAAMTVLGQLALDNKRRLLLVGCGEHRLLVLSGGTADSMLFCPPAPLPGAAS